MKKRSKWLWSIMAVLLVIAGALYFGARSFAANEARKFLTERNVPVNSLTLESISTNAVVLKDISLGTEHNFKADSLTITRLSGTSLETVRVQIDATNVSIDGLHDGKKWLMGGVENLWENGSSSAKKSDAPKAKITLRGGTISAQGSANADVEGTINAKSLRYSADGLKADLSNVVLKPKVTNNTTQLTVPFTIAKADLANEKGPLVAPLALNGTMTHKLKSDRANGTIHAADLAKKIKVTGVVAHSLSSQKGTVKLTSNQVKLGQGNDGLLLATLLPVIAAESPTPEMLLKLDSVLQYGANGMDNFTGTLAFDDLQSGSLLASALSGYGQLDGNLKGAIPFTITPDNWKINEGKIQNNGPMQLSIVQGEKQQLVSGLASLFKKNVPEGALDGVNISDLALNLTSISNDGEVRLKGLLSGHNPLIKRPVKININFTTNLNDMLRGLSKVAKVRP